MGKMKNLIKKCVKSFSVLALTGFLALPVAYASEKQDSPIKHFTDNESMLETLTLVYYQSKTEQEPEPTYETKPDLTVENGYTHIKRIYKLIQKTKVSKALSYEEALDKSINEVRSFGYKQDDVGHLQTIEETRRLRTGDCEDFTNWFLWRMRSYGMPIHRLGICIMSVTEKSLAHFMPIFQDDEGKWWNISMAPNLVEEDVVPREIYSMEKIFVEDLDKFVLRRQTVWRTRDLTTYLIKGLNDDSPVHIEEWYETLILSFEEFRKNTEDELKKQGWAID